MSSEPPNNPHNRIYGAQLRAATEREEKMKKNLIKILALTLALFMIAVMAASCSSDTKDEDGKEDKQTVDTDKKTEDTKDDVESDTAGDDGDGTETEAPAPAGDTLYGLEGVVVYEDDNCMFRIDSVTEDEFWDSKNFNVTLQNKTSDKELGFSIGDVCVNGCMLSTLFLENVKAGKTQTADFDLAIDDRTGDPQEIIMDLTVSDYNDFFGDPIVKDTFTIYTDGYDASNVKYPERKSVDGEKVVVDTDEYTVIVLGIEDTGFGLPTLELYYENKTDKDVNFDIEDVKIDGKDYTEYSGTDVTAGHCAYESASFDGDDIEGTPGKYEFKVKVSDADEIWGDPFFEQECTFEP